MNSAFRAPDQHELFTKIDSLDMDAIEKHQLEIILGKTSIFYVPDSRYRRKKFMNSIMAQVIAVKPGTSLDSQDTEVLFLQLNYIRLKMSRLHRKLLKAKPWTLKDVRSLLQWDNRQRDIRDKIVTGNLGLVLAMAKKVDYCYADFCDLISEGSMALLRATEKFDCSRDFEFSTYACRAILRSFFRISKQGSRYRNLFPVQFDTGLEKDDYRDRIQADIHQDQLEELTSIMRCNAACLSGVEQSIVQMRFRLQDDSARPLTLKQVGEQLGISKERVRQIQVRALAKIRDIAQERMDIQVLAMAR